VPPFHHPLPFKMDFKELKPEKVDFTKLTKEEIKEIILDPVLFSKYALKMPCVSETEEKILRSKAQRIIVAAGRRWGKTTCFAIYAIWYLIAEFPKIQKKNPNVNEIIMFGPSWEQCEIFMDAVKDIFHSIDPFIKSMLKVSVNQIYELKVNGIKIIALSATKNSRAIRGHGRNTGLIIRDEDAFIPDELMKVIRPVRLSNSAKEMVGSTTAGHNHFFKDFNSDVYESYKVTSYDNKFLKKDDLDEEKKLLTKAEFAQEYLAEFMDDRYSVFPQVLIDAATSFNGKFIEKPEQDIDYIMGIDFGKKRDKTVIMFGHLGEDNHVYVDFVKEIVYPLDGFFWRNTIKEIITWIKIFRPSEVHADQTGMGDSPTEDLQRKLAENKIDTFLKGVDFTRRVKNGKQGLVNSLLIKFENREIHFPFCEVLIRQLKNIRWETSSSPQRSTSMGRFTHIGHDDYVMAFALMVNALPEVAEVMLSTVSNSIMPDNQSMGMPREFPNLIVTHKQSGGMSMMQRW